MIQEEQEISKKRRDEEAQAMCLWSIGEIYFELGEREEALQYFKEALDILKRIGAAEGIEEILKKINIIKGGDKEPEREKS